MENGTDSFAQMPIELILVRQLATHLMMPIFIVDEKGLLVYYNQAAQGLLGKPYEENDEMPLQEWGAVFRPTRENDEAVLPEELPLAVALREQRPTHLASLTIQGHDGARRKIAVTAFPLMGHQQTQLGAAAIFWEVEGDASNTLGH